VSGEKIIKKLSFGGKNYKKVKFRGRSGGGSGGYPGNRDFLRIRGRSGSVREGVREGAPGQFRAGPRFQELSGTFPGPVSGQFRAGPRFQELSGTFRNFPEASFGRPVSGRTPVSGTFRNFQELSRGQFRASFGPEPVSGTFRNFQELSGTFKSGRNRFQELSGTFRNF